jgi:hypothetical protein
MIHELVQRMYVGHWPAASAPNTAMTAPAQVR